MDTAARLVLGDQRAFCIVSLHSRGNGCENQELCIYANTLSLCIFQEKRNRKELIQEGLKELRIELSKWKGEVIEKFEDDPIIVRPGETLHTFL